MSKKKRKKPNVHRPAGATAKKNDVAVAAAKSDVGVSPAPDVEKPSPNKPNGRAAAGAPAARDAAETAATQSADRMSTSRRAVDRELALGRAAYELFLAEGGGDLEALMENGQCTARAYTSQIRAAEEGGQGWGPTVTPYEDRMTRSLQLRLIKERRKWIEECRQRIQAAMEESDVAVPAAPDQEKPSPGGATGRGDIGADLEASAGETPTSLGASGTPTSLGADRMSTSRIAAIGERMAEEARAETAMMEEAIAQAHAEIAREREPSRPPANGAIKQVEAVSQQAADSP